MSNNFFISEFLEKKENDFRKLRSELLKVVYEQSQTAGYKAILNYLINEYKIKLKNRSALNISDMIEVQKNCVELNILSELIKDLKKLKVATRNK